jgi:predicted metalloprotease with PDZ domain
VLQRQRKGEQVGLDQWVDLVVRELGPDARRDYEDMVSGRLIVPPENAFGPCFTLVKEEQRPFVLGFDEMRLGVVKDLVAGSPAAQAGVKEGDTIVALTPVKEVRDDPSKTMNLTLRRGESELKVSYLPRGAPVPAWHWVRNSSVPDSQCGI